MNSSTLEDCKGERKSQEKCPAQSLEAARLLDSRRLPLVVFPNDEKETTSGAIQIIEAGPAFFPKNTPDGTVSPLPCWEAISKTQKLIISQRLFSEELEKDESITLNLTFRPSSKEKPSSMAEIKKSFSRKLRKLSPCFLFSVEDSGSKDKAHFHASIQVPRPVIDSIPFTFEGLPITTKGMTNRELTSFYQDQDFYDFKKALREALSGHFLSLLSSREGYNQSFRWFALDVQPNYSNGWGKYITKEAGDSEAFISRPLLQRTKEAYEATRSIYQVRLVNGLDLRPIASFVALRAVFNVYPYIPTPVAFRLASTLRNRLLPLLIERRSLSIKTGKAIKRGKDLEKIERIGREEAECLAVEMLSTEEMAGYASEANTAPRIDNQTLPSTHLAETKATRLRAAFCEFEEIVDGAEILAFQSRGPPTLSHR